MPKLYRIFLVAVVVVLVGSCTTPATVPPTFQPTPTTLPKAKIAWHPKPLDFRRNDVQLVTIPKYDPKSNTPFQIDLRSIDLTRVNMTESLQDLLYAVFDSKTQWPASDKMPPDFDWQKIMEIGKNPGLGVRSLHDQGITGKGVNIAIIDQPLIIDHIEYPERIRLYEEINVLPDTPSQLHGPGVTSIAVGKTVGIAPDANVYYIAQFDFDLYDPNRTIDYGYTAQAIRRILEINEQLPADQKIRAISMSIGLHPEYKGYDEIIAAIQDAKEAGIFPITVRMNATYGWNMLGLGRDPILDPDQFQSYKPALWWEQDFIEQGLPQNTLLIPMDSRTTASPTGKKDYVFYGQGGGSWTAPYLAGMYALAVQVKPNITPEEFWDAALKTGKTIPIQLEGKEYQLGVILNPPALIEAIKQ